MPQTGLTGSSGHQAAGSPASSSGSAFRHPLFRRIWTASLAATIGTWLFNAAAGWLMTSLAPSPVMVSLVQVAASVPLFLFALPAGALADVIDRRRLVLGLEVSVSVVAALFAALVSADRTTAGILLAFMFVFGTLSAVEAPAWQAIVPQLVPRRDLASAIAANSVGINISRAIGPALAGIIITGLGLAAPFWLVAVSNFGVIGVFLWWKPPQARRSSLPAERIMAAIRTGLRYVRYSRRLRATLARSVGFFVFASAYWALLPLLARKQIGGGPDLYGLLLGAIGAGAVGSAFLLPKLKGRIDANTAVMAGEAGTALALVLFGLSGGPVLATFACLIAGACWIAVVANLNVSAQTSLPDWVRARGLAMFVTVFYGSMSIGSIAWGEVANAAGLPAAHWLAAAGALLAIPLTRRFKLRTGTGIDLTPSMHWPEPILAGPVAGDAGPVMVTMEYRIDPKDRDTFLAAIERLGPERRRDGAYAWDVFQDTADPSHFVEVFMVESWLEHLRQHRRVTNADRVVEQHVRRLLRDPPRVTHLIAAPSPE